MAMAAAVRHEMSLTNGVMSKCPQGWDHHKKLGCFLHDTSCLATWSEAVNYCNMVAGHQIARLAQPHTKKMLNYIKIYAQQHHKSESSESEGETQSESESKSESESESKSKSKSESESKSRKDNRMQRRMKRAFYEYEEDDEEEDEEEDEDDVGEEDEEEDEEEDDEEDDEEYYEDNEEEDADEEDNEESGEEVGEEAGDAIKEAGDAIEEAGNAIEEAGDAIKDGKEGMDVANVEDDEEVQAVDNGKKGQNEVKKGPEKGKKGKKKVGKGKKKGKGDISPVKVGEAGKKPGKAEADGAKVTTGNPDKGKKGKKKGRKGNNRGRKGKKKGKKGKKGKSEKIKEDCFEREPCTRNSGPWLGAKLIPKLVKGDMTHRWLWEHTGKKVDRHIFPRFIKDTEVPEFNDQSPENSNCMELYSNDGTVNDMKCERWKLHPLCHIPNKALNQGCPKHWDRIEPYGCFYHQKEPLTWQEARNRCQAMYPQAYLAEPQSKAAYRALGAKYAKHQNPFVMHPKDVEQGPWLGATDRKSEGHWKWDTTGKEIDRRTLVLSSFDDDEGPTHGEDCLAFWNKQGVVNDMDCKLWNITSLCEMPIAGKKPDRKPFIKQTIIDPGLV